MHPMTLPSFGSQTKRYSLWPRQKRNGMIEYMQYEAIKNRRFGKMPLRTNNVQASLIVSVGDLADTPV